MDASNEKDTRATHRKTKKLRDSETILKDALQKIDTGAMGDIRIPVMYVEADGTGVAMNRQALAGVKGRGAPDGKANTRVVKTGRVFTQAGQNRAGAARWSSPKSRCGFV